MTNATTRRWATGALIVAFAASLVTPATSAARATGPGAHSVVPEIVYPGEKPGGPFVGSLSRGQTFIVTRLSASGRWAYGHGAGRKVFLKGWVRSAALKPRTGPQLAG